MGSDNSKSQPTTPQKREENFQYGPTTRSRANERAQRAAPSHQPPPPPYSSLDPLHNVARNLQHIPVTVGVSPQPQALPNSSAQHHTQNQFKVPPVPQRQNVHKQNPRAHSITRSSTPSPTFDQFAIPAYHNQARQYNNYTSRSSTPSPLHSPTYDRTHNPYVWVSNKKPKQPETVTTKKPGASISKKPQGKKKTFDFDLELPKVLERIKNKPDAKYQDMIKQTRKNKPLADVRSSLVNDKYMSDVHFIVDGKIFHAHKMFLVTSSFLFFEHFEKNGNKEMKVDSVNYETFQKVMTYCYTDQLKPTEEDVLDLLRAANDLQVRQITNICSGFISNLMNPSSIFFIFEKALKLENEHFKTKCLDFIKKNEEKCFASEGFHKIALPSLIKILETCNYPADKREEIIGKHFFSYNQPKMFQQPPPQAPTHDKGAVKKPPAKKQNKPPKTYPNRTFNKSNSIPDLMSLPVPPIIPPLPSMYKQPNHHRSQPLRNKVLTAQLINLDDDDDKSSVISRDEEIGQTEIFVFGATQKYAKPSSRIDFVCKRSMLVHKIQFSENLSNTCNWVRLSVNIVDGSSRHELRTRLISNSEGKRMNFVPFNRDPFIIYVGQAFFIKLEFDHAEPRYNIDPTTLNPNDFLELYNADGNKHFNCIKSLMVSSLSPN